MFSAGIAAVLAAGIAATILTVNAGQRAGSAEQDVLRSFQIRVLSVSQAAAENRLDGALAALQGLENDLDNAARDGRISAPRLRGIESAVGAVRTDLTAQLESRAAAAGTAVAATAPPAAVPAAEATTAGTTEPAAGSGQPAPEAPAAPAQAPAVQQPNLPPAAYGPQGKAKGHNRP